MLNVFNTKNKSNCVYWIRISEIKTVMENGLVEYVKQIKFFERRISNLRESDCQHRLVSFSQIRGTMMRMVKNKFINLIKFCKIMSAIYEDSFHCLSKKTLYFSTQFLFNSIHLCQRHPYFLIP